MCMRSVIGASAGAADSPVTHTINAMGPGLQDQAAMQIGAVDNTSQGAVSSSVGAPALPLEFGPEPLHGLPNVGTAEAVQVQYQGCAEVMSSPAENKPLQPPKRGHPVPRRRRASLTPSEEELRQQRRRCCNRAAAERSIKKKWDRQEALRKENNVIRNELVLLQRLICLIPMSEQISRVSKNIELILRRDIPFKDFTGQQLKHVVAALSPQTFVPGQAIITEGQPCDTFFIIMEGTAIINKKSQQIAYKVHPGQSFGALALIRDLYPSETVSTLTDVKCLSLTRTKFWSLFPNYVYQTWSVQQSFQTVDPQQQHTHLLNGSGGSASVAHTTSLGSPRLLPHPVATEISLPATVATQERITPAGQLDTRIKNVPVVIEAVALWDFKAQATGQVSLRQGDAMELLSRAHPDWWLVRTGSQIGYVPASFLQISEASLAPQTTTATSTGSVSETSNAIGTMSRSTTQQAIGQHVAAQYPNNSYTSNNSAGYQTSYQHRPSETSGQLHRAQSVDAADALAGLDGEDTTQKSGQSRRVEHIATELSEHFTAPLYDVREQAVTISGTAGSLYSTGEVGEISSTAFGTRIGSVTDLTLFNPPDHSFMP